MAPKKIGDGMKWFKENRKNNEPVAPQPKAESTFGALVIGLAITGACHVAVALGLGMLWNSVVHSVMGGIYLSSLDAVLLWTFIMVAFIVPVTIAAKIWSRVNVLTLDLKVTLPPELLNGTSNQPPSPAEEVQNEPPKQFPSE